MKQFKNLTKRIIDFDRYAILRGALLMFLLVSILAYGVFSMSAGFFVILLIMALFVFWINGRVAKVKKNDVSSQFHTQMINRVLATALADTSIRVFIYYKNTCKMVFLKGGENSDGNDGDAVEKISQYEGFSSDDARKLRNSIAIAGVGKNVKVTLLSNRDGKQTFLRYTLTGAKDENGDPTIVIGTARDITADETDRRKKIDLEKFRNSVVTYKTTGFEISLERNKWKIMWMNEPAVEKTGIDVTHERNDYDRDISKYVLPAIHPSEKESFNAFLDRLTLLEDFRRGKTEKSFVCRIASGADKANSYEYRVIEVHLLRDKSTDEAKADVYVRNIENAELEKFTVKQLDEMTNHILSSVLSFISDTCVRAAFAELDEGVIIPVSFNGREFLPKLEKFELDEFMKGFCKEYVKEDFRAEFLQKSNKAYLLQQLKDKKCISFDFEVLMKTHNKSTLLPVTRYVYKCDGEQANQIVVIEKAKNKVSGEKQI